MIPRIVFVLTLAVSLDGCALNSGHDTQAANDKPNLWERLKRTDDNIDAAMQRSDNNTWKNTELHGDSWNPD